MGAGRTTAGFVQRKAHGATAAGGSGGGHAGARGDGLVVEQGPPGPGQMLASTFRERASVLIREATEAQLGATAMFGLPRLDQFRLALTCPDSDVEAVVHELAPDARGATTADELLHAMAAAVRRIAAETAGPKPAARGPKTGRGGEAAAPRDDATASKRAAAR